MIRIVAAAVLTLAFAVSNTPAQTNNPPAKADDTAKAPAPQQDPGTRKLSRRERKDRIAKLSDEYREFIKDVEPIMTPAELDTFLILETDAQRDTYIIEFWRRRDALQGTTNGAYKQQYYDRLEVAKTKYKQASSDRSRIYLMHGEPANILATHCERLLQPLEIWTYPYLQGYGTNFTFVFYLPRHGFDYKLWDPNKGGRNIALADLVSDDAYGSAVTPEGAVQSVFHESASPYSRISKIESLCQDGPEIMRALFKMESYKTELLAVWEPPKMNEEDVKKILRSAVIPTPNAPKLVAEMSVRYPAKQGMKTDAEMTVLVPKAQLTPKAVGEARVYSLDVTGEVLKNDQMYENYRYRFDYPADVKDEKLPLIIERFLRPGDYKSRIRVTDVHSGAETIIEQALSVPEIFDTPEQAKAKAEGTATVTALKDDIETNETKLRIVPMGDDLLSGLQHIETIAVGADIKAVEFYLDGKKVVVKRRPPYTLDLDFGDVPQVRKVRAVALNEKGEILTGDEIVLNTGTDPFRVRIVSPRVAVNVKGKTRVEMSVRVPEGKELEAVELYLNETKVATLFDGPFVQTVHIPETVGVGYLRAVARLKDEPTSQIEDVVMINTPEFMETLDVHLVELPTTVLINGRPSNTLDEKAFKVFDEGKPVKVAKFEKVANLPLSIGMAIDTSGSMQPRMYEAQKAAATFFQNVMKKGDKAFVVAFDSQPSLIQKWSPRLADVTAGLAKLRAEESTALNDAIVYSLYNFLGVKGQKALVVLSDGKDTASKFNYDQTIEYARRAAVPIYVIGLGIRAGEIDVRYKLGRLAGETGGNVYYIDRADELARIYDDIQAELRSQYVLGFYPPSDVKPGSKWREVSVQVSEGKVKTIRGYYP